MATEPMTDRLFEGYFWPAEARKQHYMVDGRSLCGRWGVIVGRSPLDSGAPPGSVCVVCERKQAKRMTEDDDGD